MPRIPDQHQVLAFALYELRLLLAGHLDPDSGGEPAVRAAAHLAYALHNQALAVLEGKSFDPVQAVEAIAKWTSNSVRISCNSYRRQWIVRSNRSVNADAQSRSAAAPRRSLAAGYVQR
jgi:hypothetical protein